MVYKENTIRVDNLGVTPFQETSTCRRIVAGLRHICRGVGGDAFLIHVTYYMNFKIPKARYNVQFISEVCH